MNLAAILTFYLLGLAWSPPLVRAFAAQATEQHPAAATDSKSSATQIQSGNPPSQPAQAPDSTQSPPPSQPPTSAGPGKTSPKRRHHRKKTVDPNCSTSLTSVNSAAGTAADSAKATVPASTEADTNGAASSAAGSANTEPADGGSTNGSAQSRPAPLKPCPPPKKVVRNGGSNEATVQLMGGTAGEQAARQRSTDELTTATKENLNKIADRELSPTQREMVNQIKQFMEQSKSAVASGDAERGHNLALKARLLSDELVKP